MIKELFNHNYNFYIHFLWIVKKTFSQPINILVSYGLLRPPYDQ